MKKILLVDDGSAMCSVIQEVLGDGYRVLHASGHASVGITIDRYSPQVIIVNVASMGGKALESVESIRKNSPAGKKTRLVITGAEGLVKGGDYSKYHALDVIGLPLDPDEFYERIEEVFITACGLRDEVTGCYKRVCIESKIRDRLSLHRRGTMFLVNIDSKSFVSNTVSGADLQLCVYAMRTELTDAALLGINGDTIVGFIPGEEGHKETLDRMNGLIEIMQKAIGDRKIYISIGVANASEYDYSYEELYLDCDRALGLSRESGKNRSSYYRMTKTD